MAKNGLVGTWKLVSAKTKCSDGQVMLPYGEYPRGVIMYDEAGNVSVNIMRSDRPRFSIPDKAKCTPQEAQAAIESYEAYFGSYEVEEDKQVVIHHVEGSLLANWTGTDQIRFYELSQNQLVLSTAEILYAGTTVVGKLVWKRAA